ncbi:kinesin-like protein KIN-14I isoform X1 [Lycium ferocissimum]|uniref:kinesin-like protein KIN-14I isoform X1 n=1 Tax=Lycium ferocissimum TaxID=112874 RepID=UPI00281689CD|nr:kinesin-like protein KIN-14I isoform X1 [Lycium ferocissimum]
MAADGALSFSVASVVEDVLQQHGNRSRTLDLDARRAEEAATRRYEAAAWLRKVVGFVGAKDLPAEPSEEDFRLGLRSGIILCNVLNKMQPGAVPKVVESPVDSALIPDGAALSAYQYFENVRNFLVAAQELGIPSFEASDLEQGGKSSRVVNCVLGLKDFSEWKKTGGTGVWKFGGNVKSTTSAKQFLRKNSEPFSSSLSRSMSINEKSMNGEMSSSSLSNLVRAILIDKKPEEVPNLVESVLSKVVEEFEQRIASQIQLNKATPKESKVSCGNKFLQKHSSAGTKVDQRNVTIVKEENRIANEELKRRQMIQNTIVDQQQIDIKDLKQTLLTTKAGMQFMQMKFHEEMHNIGMHIHGLAHAASGYHRVLEENRKLYNQVQDLKGSIRVYCRVRPFLPGQSSYISNVDHIDDGSITIGVPSKNGKGRKSFNFNKVFGPSATQGEVFSDTQQLIRSVLDGYNVCIFAYGQTGSGKTFTMSGPKDLTEQSRGVNYRALGDLFLLAEQRKDTFLYDVSVQMIEIYNEQVRDLLVSDGVHKRLEIRSASQGLSVPDASLVRVTSTSDVIDLMNLGQKNRAVSATALNDRSSRSHSCLTVHVQGRDLTSGAILRGCMHLVDLAGSERVDKSEVTGDRLKEAQHINKSLSALGDVISALAQKNAHVPYRNSKLTQLLQDSLGGQAKTLMFVHISPEPDAVGETISTLKFAERVSTVELGAARVNKDTTDVKELKEQIASLKAALARKETESVSMSHKVTSSPCGLQSSPLQSNPQGREMLGDSNIQRRAMEDVGNREVSSNSAFSRQKRQSFDLDELLGNSSPWPPVSSPSENYVEDDNNMSSGEWVDKVMVNKQDHARGFGNLFGCWESEKGNGSDVLYEKYLSDSSKVYQEKSSNLFQMSNHFDITTTEDLDEFDATTSDSSEPDLLWQFNNSKVNTFPSVGNGSKIQRPNTKLRKSPESRNTVHKVGPPLSRQTSGIGQNQRNGRQAMPAEMKRKAGSRK